jgi:hypothetical protein
MAKAIIIDEGNGSFSATIAKRSSMECELQITVGFIRSYTNYRQHSCVVFGYTIDFIHNSLDWNNAASKESITTAKKVFKDCG